MRSHMFYRPNPIKRILWIAGIVILALLIVVGAAYLAKLYQGREREIPVNNEPKVTSLDFELDPGVNYKNAIGEDTVYFYSSENLKMLDSKGNLIVDTALKLSRPGLSVSGKRALFFDMGGRNIIAYSGSKQTLTKELDANIILASVNENGYMLIVTQGDLHNCVASVYNPGGEEIFKWNSGGLSVVAADISDNNRDITVSAINTDEGKIKNHIIIFNILKEKPYTSDVYEGDILSVLAYSGNHLYCIGSDSTYIYNNYGKCVGTASYIGRDVQEYALDGNLFVLAFSGTTDTAGVAELVSYNHKGEETGRFAMSQEYDFFDVKDGNIAVNSGRNISILGSHCQEKRQINLGFDLRDFAYFETNRKGIGITASGAELIHLG